MEIFRIIIDIEEDKKWKCSIKQTQIDNIKSFVCLLKLIWWSLSLVQIWHTRKNNPSYLLHNLLCMDVIFTYSNFTYYCITLTSLTLIMLCIEIL
jgi:hypothetical protein